MINTTVSDWRKYFRVVFFFSSFCCCVEFVIVVVVAAASFPWLDHSAFA